MTDPAALAPWLAAFRRACDRIGESARAMPPAERAVPQGRGAGGDETAWIDRLAEDIVLEELTSVGLPARVVTEELGEAVLPAGPGDGTVIVVDPIDGSLNATRGLPGFSTSLALAEGPAMGDVVLGLVRDHVSGEEWLAERGAGAFLDGEPIAAAPGGEDGRMAVVLLEGAYPRVLAPAAEALAGRVGRVRVVGSLALSLCHVAAGRADGMAGLAPGRAVDLAAAQLLAREAGLIVGMPDQDDLPVAPLDVTTRIPVVAAPTHAGLELLVRAAGSAIRAASDSR
jgi:myo-inositol-1(or 4)-monophosphatase